MAETPGRSPDDPPHEPLRRLHNAARLRADRVALSVRLAVLALVVAVSLGTEPSLDTALWCLLLAAAALPSLVPGVESSLVVPGAVSHRAASVVARLGRVAEVVVVCLAATRGPAMIAVLPYLVVPTAVAGLLVGVVDAVGMAALAGVLLGGVGAYTGLYGEPGAVAGVVEWLAVATLGAVVSSWFGRTLQAVGVREQSSPEHAYVEASRLLTRLRAVARQMPGTLDPGSLAERLLDEVLAIAPADRAAVFTGSGGGRLALVAQNAPDRVDWETSLDADTQVAETWVSQQPLISSRSLVRSASNRQPVTALVLPLVTGLRTLGIVALEADAANAYSQDVVGQAAEAAMRSALPLETALLFDEVRSMATAEERKRLAREIHDGIAQELVIVGYGVDDALAHLPSADGKPAPEAAQAAESLRALRAEVTRIITELRFSLFELRADVERHGALGIAIGDFARTVAGPAGLRIHLQLDESTARLPASVESELLRIAQEAITNARKHARADNLWVSCEVDPPYARIEVSDDGRGISEEARRDSYGLSIMAERTKRIRGHLDVSAREPSGTTVTVTLGARLTNGRVQREEVQGDNGESRDERPSSIRAGEDRSPGR
jgi:signal transduction histidine kinase